MPQLRRRTFLGSLFGLAGAVGLLKACGGVRWAEGAPPAVSDHFDGTRFFNPGLGAERGFSDFLRWQTSGERQAWPDRVENTAVPSLPAAQAPGEVAVTFVGHASFLIQLGGVNILTDPVWSERASPVSFAGPKRVRAPGIAFEALPRIDLVLVSHNHYDHMDLDTLHRLAARFDPLFVTSLGNRGYLEDKGLRRVAELDWWQSHRANGLEIVFTPAQHFAARGVFDRNATLWGGFLIRGQGRQLYFAGDSGYFPGFKEIGRRAGPIDLALLPIGAYEPRWFMQPMHMNPEEAVQTHLDIGAKRSVAMHFGTFQLTDEAIDAPPAALRQALAARGLTEADFQVPEVGQTMGGGWV
ncbi:MAG TPA: MBL fold metallo-hydrolase [Alphaproteobacteria bacterium]|nr:MBL fold metallo-hydrolase [Alphaproteobacteria bacterium]